MERSEVRATLVKNKGESDLTESNIKEFSIKELMNLETEEIKNLVLFAKGGTLYEGTNVIETSEKFIGELYAKTLTFLKVKKH